MSIQVTNQNVDQVLGKFESFVSDANASLGKGAVAYLFPGLRNSSLESIDKPIFASRSFWRNSSVFRSADDKRVNNYVRHLFLTAIATKLKCEVGDVPRVFAWAGKLDDLKVNDFNADGRPLTARRIGTILADLKTIEYKRLGAVDAFRAKKGEDAKLPAYYTSAGTLSAHKLKAARQAALPKLDIGFQQRPQLSVAALDDKTSDNYLLGREQMTEEYSNVTHVKVTYTKSDRSDGTYKPTNKQVSVTAQHMRTFDPGYKKAIANGKAEVKRFKALINDDLTFSDKMSEEDREFLNLIPKTRKDNAGREVALTKKEFLEAVEEKLGWDAGEKYVRENLRQYDKNQHEQRIMNHPILQERLEAVRNRVKIHGGNLAEELKKEELEFRKDFETDRGVELSYVYGGDKLRSEINKADLQERQEGDYESEVDKIY